MMITVLSGGTGSIKLIRGLRFLEENITIVVNIGDNITKYGLYITPDIDTIIYGLSNQLDKKKGWGIKNDSFNFLNKLAKISNTTLCCLPMLSFVCFDSIILILCFLPKSIN